MIPYGKQNVNNDDISAVVEVLLSDFLTTGPGVPAFETGICTVTGAKHAIAVNSATSALHVACLALGLGNGDYLWTSPITFVASANVARLCGADVDFVDVDPDTLNICPVALERKLKRASLHGKLPKIIMPVHMCGTPCDMKKIAELAMQYEVKIIEDASHALGAYYKGNTVGACDYSDITVFSFHPVKIITTGEGGVATTNNELLAEKMRLLRSHGVTRDTNAMQGRPHGAWYYEQIDLGLNYRMSDLCAGLGLSQLNRLEQFVNERNRLAENYDNAFCGSGLIKLPARQKDVKSAFHLYVVKVPVEKRLYVFNSLRDVGIGVNVHYIPVYWQPYYVNLGFERGHCPIAEDVYAQILSLPLFPTLTERDQQYIISSIERFVS